MLKKWLPALISVFVVLAIIYVGLYWYVNAQANKMVAQALNGLKQGNQQVISNIQYNSVDATPWSYFSDEYAVNGLTITLKKSPKQKITIGQVMLSDVATNKAGVLTTAKLSISNFKATAWKAYLLKSLDPNLSLALGNSIKALKIALNLSATYKAQNQSLELKINLTNNQTIFAWAEVKFSKFFINAPITDLQAWQPAAGQALNTATVQSSHFKIKTNFDQSAQQLIKQAPFLATTLGELGYHKLTVKLESDGQYSGKTQVSQQAARLSMKAGGNVTFAIHMKRKKPMHFVDLIALVEGLNWQQQNSSIQSVLLTVSDRGWLTHANQWFQYEFGESAYNYLKSYINGLPKNANWSIETKAALLAFLQQPGSTLNISAKPDQPFYPDQISAYAEQINQIRIDQGKNNHTIDRSINKKNPDQTNKLNQQMIDLISQLMSRINYHATQY